MQYRSLGCWNENPNAVTPLFIGKDYTKKANPAQLCYEDAVGRGDDMFALRNGGWCVQVPNNDYETYGKAENCRDGKGGAWANNIYQVGGKFHFVQNIFTTPPVVIITCLLLVFVNI